MGEIWGRVIVTPHPNPLPQGERTKTSLSLRERAGERVPFTTRAAKIPANAGLADSQSTSADCHLQQFGLYQ